MLRSQNGERRGIKGTLIYRGEEDFWGGNRRTGQGGPSHGCRESGKSALWRGEN